jgi:protease I
MPLAVVFVEDMYECLEYHYPRLRLLEEGWTVEVVAPEANKIYKSKVEQGGGYWAKSTKTVRDIDPATVQVVIIPGGFCCDRLRRFPDICQWLHDAHAKHGAICAAICHAGWLAVSAKILKGVKCTCFFAIKDDLENAGALVDLNQKCVVDEEHRFVSAQTPDDLPAFMKATIGLAAKLFATVN